MRGWRPAFRGAHTALPLQFSVLAVEADLCPLEAIPVSCQYLTLPRVELRNLSNLAMMV
jgi:hypothetical protein